MTTFEAPRLVHDLLPELVEFRRDMHRNPELGFAEHRATQLLIERLERAGLAPRPLDPTGLVLDIGNEPRIMLRADLDALPLVEESGVPFASEVPGVMHACGHDLHTAIALGAALTLAEMHEAGELLGGVRILFQPAEEVQPGGARHVMDQGVLDGVASAYALHCDPSLEVGTIGLKAGAITASSDTLRVTVRSPGGHTSRPHLTGDVINGLGQIITQTGAILDRRLDARAGVNLTWGTVHAGSAPNVIPSEGTLFGTLRCLDSATWEEAGDLAAEAIPQIVAPFGLTCEVDRVRGLPPVVNSFAATEIVRQVGIRTLGASAVRPTEQSLGGEDFAWFLTEVPGALFRLGTRTPGGPIYDLHRSDAEFDEDAISVGVRLMVNIARQGLRASDTER